MEPLTFWAAEPSQCLAPDGLMIDADQTTRLVPFPFSGFLLETFRLPPSELKYITRSTSCVPVADITNSSQYHFPC